MERASGLLLHPTSLPGPYGIGDLGSEAYKFADFLAEAGQHLWQLLPLAPGSKGKVRLEVRGQTVDLVAVSDEPDCIESGQRVVVIDIRDNQAVVVSAGTLVS